MTIKIHLAALRKYMFLYFLVLIQTVHAYERFNANDVVAFWHSPAQPRVIGQIVSVDSSGVANIKFPDHRTTLTMVYFTEVKRVPNQYEKANFSERCAYKFNY